MVSTTCPVAAEFGEQAGMIGAALMAREVAV